MPAPEHGRSDQSSHYWFGEPPDYCIDQARSHQWVEHPLRNTEYEQRRSYKGHQYVLGHMDAEIGTAKRVDGWVESGEKYGHAECEQSNPPRCYRGGSIRIPGADCVQISSEYYSGAECDLWNEVKGHGKARILFEPATGCRVLITVVVDTSDTACTSCRCAAYAPDSVNMKKTMSTVVDAITNGNMKSAVKRRLSCRRCM